MRNNEDYGRCVEHCNETFAGKTEALVACINGCAVVNAPTRQVTDVFQKIQAQVEKVGQRELLRQIQQSARAAVGNLPDDVEIGKLNVIGRMVMTQFCNLIESGCNAAAWNTSQLASYVSEVAWAKRMADVNVVYMRNNGTGQEKTCAGNCLSESDKCIKEHVCDDSGWICICCIPCSLQYMGCVAKCTVSSSGGVFGLSIA